MPAEVDPFDQAAGLAPGSAPWVRARVREALAVLRATPLDGRDFPAGHRSCWPRVVRAYWEVMGPDAQGEGARRRAERAAEINAVRPRPPAPAITRAQQAIEWSWWLNPTQRLCLWGRAAGLSRPALARRLGLRDRTGRHVYNYEQQAIRAILSRLS